MCFNVGVIIGPLLSGFLADPVHSLPGLFGPGSLFGGTDGVQWLMSFPYALPNLFCSVVLGIAALGVILGLDETHQQLRHRPDLGRNIGRYLIRMILRRHHSEYVYERIGSEISPISTAVPLCDNEPNETPLSEVECKGRTPFRAVLTRNVCLTMLQRFLQSLHVSAFNSIFFSLLPTPKADSRNFHLPF